MSDSYLAISSIANDEFMIERMRAAVTQQVGLGNFNLDNLGSVITWVDTNRYVWAASPGWGEKWRQAYTDHPDDDTYEPGKDSEVITDGDILATVQSLG